jgi:hypothetical protein
MNAFFKIFSLFLMVGIAATLTSMADKAALPLGSVSVTLENKCTRDVNYTLRVPGQKETAGVVEKGSKKKLDLVAGTVVCVDGEAFMTIAETDKGQTFMVCR